MRGIEGAGQDERAGEAARLFVLIGAAGSGKSTAARATWAPRQILSLDDLRGAVSGDPCDQSATAEAVSVLHQLVHARMRRRLTTVVDATNVESGARAPLLAASRSWNVPAVAVVVATPLPVCLARNNTRPGPAAGARWGRRVPERAVRAQHSKLLNSLPSLPAEGFAQVIIHGEDLDAETRTGQAVGE